MNSKNLYKEDGSIGGHYCNKCGRIWTSSHASDLCCKCIICGRTREKDRYTLCPYHIIINSIYTSLKYKAKEKRALENAEEVSYYDFLWFDGKIYNDTTYILEDIPEDERFSSDFIFLAKPVHFTPFSFEEVINKYDSKEFFSEEYIPSENLKGMDEFREAFDKFNEINGKTIFAWDIDTTRKFRVARDGKILEELR